MIKVGSLPLAGPETVVFKLRPVKSIVIVPAKTGREVSKRAAVTRID